MNAPQPIDRVHSVRIADIDATGRLRQVDPAHAQLIADSILALRTRDSSGLQHPITVRPLAEGGYRLVMGGHRLAACVLLGDAEIDCHIKIMSADQARLAEIDENLCRAELTMFDRAAFLAERDTVWRALNPDAAGRKAGAKARWHHATDKMSFASEIAERMGLSERHIRRDVKMWADLSLASRERIPGTWLADHQAQLKALSKLGPQQQSHVLDVMLRPDSPAPNVAAALAEVEGRKSPQIDPTDKAFGALVALWARTPAAAKDRFRAHIAEQGA